MRTTSLGIAIVLALSCLSCLEAPSSPRGDRTSPDISVVILKNGDTTSALQIDPGDKFQLSAIVTPANLADRLTFTWIQDGDTLSTGQTTSIISTRIDSLAMLGFQLRIEDPEGNYTLRSFQVMQDTPPRLGEAASFIPAPEDKLWTYQHEALSFQWNSDDEDDFDNLEHYIDFRKSLSDSTILTLNTGNARSMSFGGLDAGDYHYRIRVEDSMQLADTSEWISIHVRWQAQP